VNVLLFVTNFRTRQEFSVPGLLWNELKELWHEGVKNYFCKLWNIVDFCMLLILITSFTSRTV